MNGKTTGLTVILPQRQQRFILTYPGTMYEMNERDLDLSYVFSAKHPHVSSYLLQKGLRASLVNFRKVLASHVRELRSWTVAALCD